MWQRWWWWKSVKQTTSIKCNPRQVIEQSSPLFLLKMWGNSPSNMRFQVLCSRVALQFETPWICGRVFIFPSQFALLSFPLAVTFLRNWKTTISLTIICHSISVFLAKKDRTSKCRWKLEEIDSQSKPVWPDFIYDQSARENWTHVSLSCILIRQAYFYNSRVE